MQEEIRKKIKKVLEKLQLPEVDFVVESTEDEKMGDYATNVAMVLARQAGKNPMELAEDIKNEIANSKNELIEKVEVAGPGFINFFLKPEVFLKNIEEVLKVGDDYGKNKNLKGKKIMVEYTDPNVMKPFHIGHLMTNAVGESISRLVEFSGAQVKRANYYSDAGLALAKAVWGMMDLKQEMPEESADIVTKTDFLGKAYAHGVKQSEERPDVAEEIKTINKKIYDRSDESILALYDTGKHWSLEHFEILYAKLGSTFDYLIAETSVAPEGLRIVRENVGKVFEQSEGAIVFHGEKFDPTLHTRVFINKEGLSTYEAKELALNKKKFTLFNFDQSLVFTGNEQNDYFRVILKAIEQLWPEIALRTKHFGHGMLRLPDGKMSSRKGNAITGESLIADVEKLAREKMLTSTHLSTGEQSKVATEIAVGAIKYSILKQAIGKDIIFDFEKSLSFEGDSGPYLQYTHARCCSLLAKGKEAHLEAKLSREARLPEAVLRLLERFSNEVVRAHQEYAPQKICTYLIELASAFNAYYAQNQIINVEDKETSECRLALTQAVGAVLKNGLWLLGTKAPERM